MNVRQEVIPRLPTTLANFMIIPPKRRLFIISRGKGEGEKKGKIKNERFNLTGKRYRA